MFIWQAGHMGDVALPTRKRYLLRGTWPVRSCVIRLAVLLGNCDMSCMKVGDGDLGSVCFMHG